MTRMATGNIGTVGKFCDCTVCSSDFSCCNMNVDRGLHYREVNFCLWYAAVKLFKYAPSQPAYVIM